MYIKCTKNDICKLSPTPKEGEWKIDYDSIYTLKNWITDLEIYCATPFELGFFGSCFFIGMMVASFIFPPIAEIYGKKIVVNVANAA